MGGRAEVSVAVEPGVVAPGATVRVTVGVGGDLGGVAELEAGVVCEGHWQTTAIETATPKRQLLHWGDMRSLPVVAGEVVLDVALPTDAPPTSFADLSHVVRWVALVRGRGDRIVHAAAPFVVTADRSACFARESLPPLVVTPNEAFGFTIDVPRCAWTAHPVDVSVTVRAASAIEVKRVTATLAAEAVLASAEQAVVWTGQLRHEDQPSGCRTQRRERSTEKIKPKARIAAGAEQTFRLRFDRAALATDMIPSLACPLARVHWLLTVEVETDDHGDRVEVLELNLLSEPVAQYR